jgi:hypothetical protein
MLPRPRKNQPKSTTVLERKVFLFHFFIVVQYGESSVVVEQSNNHGPTGSLIASFASRR